MRFHVLRSKSPGILRTNWSLSWSRGRGCLLTTSKVVILTKTDLASSPADVERFAEQVGARLKEMGHSK